MEGLGNRRHCGAPGPSRLATGAGWILFCLIALAAVPVAAADLGSRLRALARHSDAVVLGTCKTAESSWQEGVIVTRAIVRRHETLRGAAPATEIFVHTLGGTIGDVTMAASHGATLSPGETAVLFLRQSEYGPHYVIWGGEEGKLLIPGDVPATAWSRTERVELDTLRRWLEDGEEPR